MEGTIWIMVLKIIVFLPLTVLLIYLVLKFGGSSALKFQNGRYVRIIEKTSFSKESSIVLAAVGKRYFLISSTNTHNEILMELDHNEINEFLADKDSSMKAGLNNMFHRSRQ